MKNIFVTLLILFAFVANGQDEYRKNFSKGKLIISNVNGVEIEAYNGKDLVITTDLNGKNNCKKCPKKKDKSKGLRLINGVGEMDNSGIGLRVEEQGQTIKITQIANAFTEVNAKFKVPKGVKVVFKNTNVGGGDLIIKNMQSELEVTHTYGDVALKNVTGPMAVQNIYGDISAVFDKLNTSGSISINSTYGDMDISLPSRSRANMLMKTVYGDAYTDFDIKIDKNITENDKRRVGRRSAPPAPPTPPNPNRSTHVDSDGNTTVISTSENIHTTVTTIVDGVVEHTMDSISGMFGGKRHGSYIKGTINGGGVDVILKCSYGDIYLRKN